MLQTLNLKMLTKSILRGNKMNKIKAVILSLAVLFLFVSCGGVSNKTVIRHQKMEEGVDSPTSIEELKDAI